MRLDEVQRVTNEDLFHATLLYRAESIVQNNALMTSEVATNNDAKINRGHPRFVSFAEDLDNEFMHAAYAEDNDLLTVFVVGARILDRFEHARVQFHTLNESEIRIFTNREKIPGFVSYVKHVLVAGHEEHREEVKQKLPGVKIYFFDMDVTSEDDFYNYDLSKAEQL